MGKAYAVACDCCSYNEIFFLGAGKNDNSVPYAVLDDINAGRYGREVRDFVLASESGTLWCERKLYRCRKCGNIEIKMKVRIKADSTVSYSVPYYCSSCGKLMGQIKTGDIGKQKCPDCGGNINIISVFDWDSIPENEA